MLRTVPVEAFDVNEDGAFDNGSGFGGMEFGDESDGFGVLLVNLRVAENLQAGLVGVIHEEEGDAAVVLEVAEGDVLLVATEIREADELRIQDLYEAGWTTAMLYVGPAGFADGGHVETVTEGQEVLFVGTEFVTEFGVLFHAVILAGAAVLLLLGFDSGSEGEFVEVLRHEASAMSDGSPIIGFDIANKGSELYGAV